MEQLLLVTFFDAPAGIGASLWTDTRTKAQRDVRTHRREGGNSFLDYVREDCDQIQRMQ